MENGEASSWDIKLEISCELSRRLLFLWIVWMSSSSSWIRFIPGDFGLGGSGAVGFFRKPMNAAADDAADADDADDAADADDAVTDDTCSTREGSNKV